MQSEASGHFRTDRPGSRRGGVALCASADRAPRAGGEAFSPPALFPCAGARASILSPSSSSFVARLHFLDPPRELVHHRSIQSEFLAGGELVLVSCRADEDRFEHICHLRHGEASFSILAVGIFIPRDRHAKPGAAAS